MKLDLERDAEIDTSWLTVKNYEFKILVMVACLAENHLAFRGKLKDMCEFLGVKAVSSNREKIKEAITALEAKGDVKVMKDGQTWGIMLSNKAEKKQKIIRIKNAWVMAIRDYEPKDKDNDSVSWETTLKVLVYLCDDKREVIRYDEIGAALGIAKTTVASAVKALVSIDFGDLSVGKKRSWSLVPMKNNSGMYEEVWRVVGNKYEVGYTFK